MYRFFQKFKMRRKVSGQQGFTLIELIVTLVITIIVIAVSSSLIITGTNLFARSAQRDMQANIAETVLGFVSDQLLYAQTITEIPNPPYNYINNANDAYILQIKTSDESTNSDIRGKLFFRRYNDAPVLTPPPPPAERKLNTRNVFGSSFYSQYDIGIDIVITTPASGPMMTLTVTVYNGPREVLSRSTTKSLLNYKGTSQVIPSSGSPFCIYYTVPTV